MTSTSPESEQEGRDQAAENVAEEEGQPFPTNPIPANADQADGPTNADPANEDLDGYADDES